MPAAVPPLLPLSTWWWCLVLLQLPQALTQPQLDPNPEKASPAGQAFPYLSLDGSPLNHLLLDPRSGYLYVGAVNHLYHLSPDLQVITMSLITRLQFFQSYPSGCLAYGICRNA